MHCTLFSLLFGLAVADPTGPPKARRSNALCNFYACPSTDLQGPGAGLVSVVSLPADPPDPPELLCEYKDGDDCVYNSITSQLVGGVTNFCPPLICVPQQACASYDCPVLTSYSLSKLPATSNGELGVLCIYTSTAPNGVSANCFYLSSNGQLEDGNISEGVGLLPCPFIATCTSTGPSRRRAYIELDSRTMHEEARASKADDFEDAYQPW
ncbi:hypothetical protein CALVIDRAFT_600007 [Calocera viscosa TUFC12733]|uniref:Uncharacterized protein n=1 Tax=Calocera viscosa (strain TUFC12733) TaxID=1330018 RepID=A0A167K7M0_CALVF|nr:hypothetical protein CALVIDRAFT_600007 [Calocera viscosa TUFC12733]